MKLKSEILQKKCKNLICALIFDEMGLRKGFQCTLYDKMRRNVDSDTGIHYGSSENMRNYNRRHDSIAKDALVMLVVPFDNSRKFSIAYFSVNGSKTDTKVN